MFVKHYQILLFLSLLFFINCQGNSSNASNATGNATVDPAAQMRAMIMMYQNVCMPIPLGLDYLSPYQPNCQALAKYPSPGEELEFHCCELDFEEKKNASTRRHGCIAILTNYVDNNRYEDIIDYIERGKLDKIQEYSIFLGINGSAAFTNFIKNKTKHKVYKFDCFSGYIKSKFMLIIALSFLLFEIF